jgi:2-polyprenyl-3-methyl-5-hydroxy-6-metoxy-1,4-benzoquinol methylase
MIEANIKNFKKKYLNYLNCKIDYDVKKTKCEVCSSSKNTKIIDIISWSQNRYGYMPIVACNFCGFVFQLYRFSKKFYETFYAKYYREKIFKNPNPSKKFILDQKSRGVRLYNFLKKQKIIKKKGSMLDVGCSSGLFLSPFIKGGWECFGNDPDKGYVDYGIKKFKLPIKTEQAENMQLKKKSLDLIIIMGSLEHCYDPNIVMKKCSIAARKNCILVLEARGNPQSQSKNYFNHNHHRYFSENSLELMMIKYGFEPILSTSYPITGPTRKGGIYTIGIKKDKKIKLEKIITNGKRESVSSVVHKYKFFNETHKENR